MQPRVFVVMPFGPKEAQPASPPSADNPGKPAITIDFTLVYERLLKPALTRAGCVPFRADEEEAAGDIRTDMYYELVTADVIVADISILNANVFYELGVRHGVAPRGVFMVHGGWAKRPFDVAPDRTFDYDGKLFLAEEMAVEETWRKRVDAEVGRLATALQGAIQADRTTIGSPVYSQLVGLKPADWTNLQTARAKYFGEVFADWKGRVEVAKLNGCPGDILTLADEAPTRFHRIKLLWSAADALCSMHRFDAARSVLTELLAVDPEHRDGLTRLGLVLGRLDLINEAKVHMSQVVEKFQHDTEAHGILGRVYKDLWRLQWKSMTTLEERQLQAVAGSNYIAAAIRIYDQAARKKFDYYTGINVVSFVKLLDFLKVATSDQPVDCGITDVDELANVVRFSARNTLISAGLDNQDAVWAGATLGELELVAGNKAKARTLYRNAANHPATTFFSVTSMLDQVYLFENLGFQLEVVAEVKQVLEQRQTALEETIGGLKKSTPRFGKVAIGSGHMIDKPDRPKERFPARKEAAVRERIAAQLDEWKIGPGDLAICGGARGTDILFGELCVERGVELWLLLALPENEFLEESVRLPDSKWESRYFELRDRTGVRLFKQADRLKAPPKGTSVFARNNLWMVNTARVEVNDLKNLYALLVWDELPTGDGPGGTADCAERVKRLGGRIKIINPTGV